LTVYHNLILRQKKNKLKGDHRGIKMSKH
jgi:hypothetical protein